MTDLRCWRCGVEPEDTEELRTFNGGIVGVIATGWPSGDHEHALVPPKPRELAAAGAAAFDRIIESWS